jgi:hypothetical protein
VSVADEHVVLEHARAAAASCKRAAAAFEDFTNRLDAVVGPAEMAEYDALIAREAIARTQRTEALRGLGFSVASEGK